MLTDLKLNVFNLGHVYKDLIEQLRMNPNGHIIQPINPEDLILRFSQRLEFGAETMRVANDAVRIVQRMNRDWMTPGRRPAGICGAALVLAARMNNFRRTVREVVYVVKVQEQTIFKRLDEFKVTESSGLTVEEFRTISLERFTDPPAFYESKDGKKKRRKRNHVEFDDDGDNDRPTPADSRASSAAPSNFGSIRDGTPSQSKRARLDSQSMPPPPLPIDPNLLGSPSPRPSEIGSSAASQSAEDAPTENSETPLDEEPAPNTSSSPISEMTQPGSRKRKQGPNAASASPSKKKSSRPPKNPTTPVATQEAPTTAEEVEITNALDDPFNLSESALSALATAADPSAEEQDPPPPRHSTPIPMTEDISNNEFANDPEVTNCLLAPAEIAIKTRIWTHKNRDWLRAQQAKLTKQRLAEENGTARVIKKRTRRRRRIGDISAYADAETIGAGSPIAASTSDAVASMMEVRGFSKKINYEMMQALYRPSSSSAGSRRDSVVEGASEGLSPGGGRAVGASAVTEEGEGGAGVAPSEAGDDDEVGDEGGEAQKEVESIAGEFESVYDGGGGEEDDDDDPYGGGEGMESD